MSYAGSLSRGLIVLLAASALGGPALAGKGEWSKLQSVDKTFCCGDYDGEDVYWEVSRKSPSGYRIFVDGKWWEVPKGAMVHEPNWHGKAVVWLRREVQSLDENGDPAVLGSVSEIKCFWPAAGY